MQYGEQCIVVKVTTMAGVTPYMVISPDAPLMSITVVQQVARDSASALTEASLRPMSGELTSWTRGLVGPHPSRLKRPDAMHEL